MSTRAIVGIPTKDGFTGTYVHSDGYPSWLGVQLQRMIRAQGTTVLDTVLDNDWDQLNADQFDADTLPEVPQGAWCLEFERNSPQYYAAIWNGLKSRGHVAHPGIGIAFGGKGEQMSKDEAAGVVSWAYAVHESGIQVWQYQSRTRSWVGPTNVRFDDEATMQAFEE